MSEQTHIASALRTLTTERDALEALAQKLKGELREPFERAVELIGGIEGRVVVTGMGKSGHIANKIAATLASTGTPAFFVHPAEANHGDLGMISRQDAVLAMSWSGETEELKGVINYVKRFSIPMIGLTKSADSTLGKEATVCLALPQEKEACPLGLAPTTSAIMQLSLGDALAVALLEARGFSADDFGIYHPGGSLGASLTRVSEIMHIGAEVPLVPTGTAMQDAVEVMSEKRFGCVGVTSKDGALVGIITDGDLRRNLSKAIIDLPVEEIMTKDPITIAPDTIANSAMAVLNDRKLTALIVVEAQKPVGILHMHDLLKIGVA